jgi:hypothetical protein
MAMAAATMREKQAAYVAVQAVEDWIRLLSQAYAYDRDGTHQRVDAAFQQMAAWCKRLHNLNHDETEED